MASPAHSPLLESLCEVTTQRKGCPVNIVVLGISRESRVTLLKALVGEGKVDAEFAQVRGRPLLGAGWNKHREMRRGISKAISCTCR